MVDEEKLSEFEIMYFALLNDVEHSLKLLSDEDSEFNRRMVVKNSFSFIEGFIFTIKKFILKDLLFKSFKDLSISEILLLKEIDCFLEESGCLKTRPMKIKLLSNIRFTLNILIKILDSDYRVDYSRKEWAQIKDAVKVRNRITHPKNPADLKVSLAEVGGAVIAFRWLLLKTLLIMGYGIKKTYEKIKTVDPIIATKLDVEIEKILNS